MKKIRKSGDLQTLSRKSTKNLQLSPLVCVYTFLE